ncbi:hypothetical protein ACP26L_04010 [Paenibacillus sp. S-38]|uniref:hypothetical protein n=1 Tax=Paenibacillus sp. S-38 TaxID=3416710 RepID=UPI003CF2BAD8
MSKMMKRWLVVSLRIGLAIIAIMLLDGLKSLEQKHYAEIREVITKKGGIVVKIENYTPKETPFLNDYNKSNVIYKITYSHKNKTLTAWYRGVNVVNNIHAKNPTDLEGGHGEKWIFNE